MGEPSGWDRAPRPAGGPGGPDDMTSLAVVAKRWARSRRHGSVGPAPPSREGDREDGPPRPSGRLLGDRIRRRWLREARHGRTRVRRAAKRTLAALPAGIAAPMLRLARRIDAIGVRRAATTGVRSATKTGVRSTTTAMAPAIGPRVDDPEITIVVSSRNRAELLPIALRSVQQQDFAAFECIVVDDDSTDDAVATAQSFAAVDPRFRILHHDSAMGPSAARNAGLAAARAPYVCFLDDDDFLLAGSLRDRRQAFGDQPADVVGTFCDWINTEPAVGLEAFEPRRDPTHRPPVSFGSLGNGTPFILSSPLLRTEAIRSVGGFDEELTRAEDADLWFRLARLGFRFIDAGCLGVAYRRTPRSLVTGAPAAQLDSLLGVFERADRADPTVLGHGPLPSAEPLSVVAIGYSRRQQVLRYLALIAVDDPDRAVAEGRRGLHPAVRRAIDITAELPALRGYAAARLALSGDRLRALDGELRRVLGRLVPSVDADWEPMVDPDRWTSHVLARARPIGPRPSVGVVDPAADIDGAVILVPEARYHVDELGPIADELRGRDIPVRFMASPKTVPAALDELGRYTETVLAYAPDEIGRARAVVTLNDWGPLKQLMLTANEAGVATFAKVEGVQDFGDVESTWERNPYRTASYILAQGPNDVAALADKETFVVGSSRLERLWLAQPGAPGDHALVNVNFTFQVLTDQREPWLESVAEGTRRAGMVGLVSAHPAQRGSLIGLPLAAKAFRHEITKAGVLVSRFSTVPFEAMARGVPFVYHNPHGERFPTFTEPSGAFRVCRSVEDLAMALQEARDWRDAYRSRCAEFFERQVSMEPGHTPAARAAEVIATLSR